MIDRLGVMLRMASTGDMCTIYLLRHGRTESNAAGRLMGHLDEALAPVGRHQAAAAARGLQGRGISAVYASDLRRAFDTACIVAEALQLPVTAVSGLREINVGDWAGLTQDEIQRRDPQTYATVRADPAGNGPPNGESEAEMADRVWQALDSIAAAHAGETVLVVSHGGPLRSIVGRTIGQSQVASSVFAFDNCGSMVLEWSKAGRRLMVPSPVIG